VPEMFADFKERLSKFSRVKRNAATGWKSQVKEMLVRSIEETLLVVSWHLTPVKIHGFWSGSQFCRRDGLERVVLKLIRFWVSLFAEVKKGGSERRIRERSETKKWASIVLDRI